MAAANSKLKTSKPLLDFSVFQGKQLAVTSERAVSKPAPIPTFGKYTKRKPRTNKQLEQLNKTLDKDPSIQAYLNYIKNRNKNEGILPERARSTTLIACKAFLDFIGWEITDHAIDDLVNHKRQNPQDTQIERALEAFSNLDNEDYHLRSQRRSGTQILGIFRANFARLSLRIDHHFPPATENCTEGIVREIFKRLTFEQQMMIQWQAYAPERAKAIYTIPFEDIDLSHPNYAILHFKAINTKIRMAHICLMPLDFAKTVIATSKKAGRKTPFPNYESQWKKIRNFAEQEYHVYLHSDYLRKRFQTIAESTQMPANHYALLMGDIPKEGHIPTTYSLSTQYQVFLSKLIEEYDTYLVNPLCLDEVKIPTTQHHATSDISRIEAENASLRRLLTELLANKRQ